ncbi:hypothetical protein [Metabacillus litoralis]|uniref:hypothetical protein n=1 Tax=Metabacillus litoralis TaxID=152268 RepID=UPI00203E1F48|nr:hypothetical protein [Metabacillus litoralis]MCM3413511.1 hypothetical protein [Metabacillus litoralis]
MPFQNDLPEWNNTGTEPTQTKKDEGWKIQEKPPAPYFNWFFNRTFNVLKDLINNAIHKDQKGVANGVAPLDSNNKVPAAHLDIDTSNLATKTEVSNHTGSTSNPHNVTKSQVGLSSVQNYGIASQTESEAGTSDIKYMTPLKTKQAITSQIGTDYAAHKADDLQHVKYAVATGTANTYAVTFNPAPTAYVEGMAVAFKVPVASTAASTLNVNGLGAKGIKKANGTDVTNLKAGGIYTVRYDGTAFILQGEGASGNATASDLLSGKTATTDAGEITGTLALTGDATVDDVISGKTFYNTNPKTKVVGTGNKAKRFAEGNTILSIGSNVGSITYTIPINLDFDPYLIFIKIPGLRNGKGIVGLTIKDGVDFDFISDEGAYSVYRHLINNFSKSSVNITSSVYGSANGIYFTSGTYTIEYYAIGY